MNPCVVLANGEKVAQGKCKKGDYRCCAKLNSEMLQPVATDILMTMMIQVLKQEEIPYMVGGVPQLPGPYVELSVP